MGIVRVYTGKSVWFEIKVGSEYGAKEFMRLAHKNGYVLYEEGTGTADISIRMIPWGSINSMVYYPDKEKFLLSEPKSVAE